MKTALPCKKKKQRRSTNTKNVRQNLEKFPESNANRQIIGRREQERENINPRNLAFEKGFLKKSIEKGKIHQQSNF